ncbi:MAG: mannose-1-phosphate guanylyltransferase/mannose-6-phosphate isomerase [Rhodospirillales bacterium]|nr:mannose-1-phosphate guanylyltransferase/mannose-6-phosphate isomerase [Rhodospirillales bacterium]
MKIVPVIISGGSGTRLWPVSRPLYPKQLQPLVTERTLLQDTVSRLTGEQFSSPIVVCNEAHRFIITEQLREIGVAAPAIVLEPVGRNTAPAAAVAALLAQGSDEDAVLLIAPSDHAISNRSAFLKAVELALPAALAGRLVTFGIKPSTPETGYGYIRRGAPIENAAGCFIVDAFVEKPDLETAEGYLADGTYDWNSGMFLFRAAAFLEELGRLQPEILAACRRAIERQESDLDFIRLDAEAFDASPAESIDYAVMELTNLAALVPADVGWSDVGSWGQLWAISEKDAHGNSIVGDVILKDVKNSYIRGDGKLVAAIGISDMVVIATDDAVLVAGREHAQMVKEITQTLKDEGRVEFTTHTKVYRPWGWYQSLETGERFQVKLIGVNPGARISLQKHSKRAEHWVVVSGEATVTRGDEVLQLEENMSTYIPIGMKHRLENKAVTPLLIVEVQSGSYLGEDDIERFDDEYGRN